MIPARSLRMTVCLIVALTACTALADDRDTTSIAEFVAAKDRWDRLVGQPLRLEGRYTVFSANVMQFANCDLKFVLTQKYSSPPAKNMEVAGQLVRNKGKLEFRVSDLKPRESDDEQLKLKRALANNSSPESVYEVAAWARQRGDFYDDSQLKDAADRLYREGLAIAHEHLPPGDVAGLRKLAETARHFDVDEGVALRFLHEANRLEWSAARQAAETNYRDILAHIKRDLPGATTPLPVDRLSIRKNYETAPLAVYAVADAPTRRLLARSFYVEVALADILRSADESGRNGYKIAERIERELPELAPLADEYRQQELKYLTARLARLTRTQMVELSERYQQRGNTQQAQSVIRNWLQTQESRATESGPTDLMELGDEYTNLLQDERAAGRMYKLAWRQNPQLVAARDWLSAHGYELNGRQWSKPGEADDETTDSSIDAAIAEGRVQVGMTGAQVLKTLGTKPSSAVRMASAGKVAQLWVFEDYGITVRLQRNSTSHTSQVVEIGTIDGPE